MAIQGIHGHERSVQGPAIDSQGPGVAAGLRCQRQDVRNMPVSGRGRPLAWPVVDLTPYGASRFNIMAPQPRSSTMWFTETRPRLS